MAERFVHIDSGSDMLSAFGAFDGNLHKVEAAFHVHCSARNNEIRISGSEEDCAKAASALTLLIKSSTSESEQDPQKVDYIISAVESGEDEEIPSLEHDVICVTCKGKPIKAKTVGQKHYATLIRNNTVTICVGPAGTGKTYLAVAEAVTAFRKKEVSRIILTRPAVEAGERLGFLPGDLQNKVDPYLRPLYDALFEMFGPETYQKLTERGDIEVAPLAYMRGRTLDDSFIILDEAQNSTREQMKMFLTRLGFGSKMVITGDVTQIDLAKDQFSGLKDAVKVLSDIPDIGICHLTARDVVRHKLVQQIVNAYDAFEHRHEKKSEAKNTRGEHQ